MSECSPSRTRSAAEIFGEYGYVCTVVVDAFEQARAGNKVSISPAVKNSLESIFKTCERGAATRLGMLGAEVDVEATNLALGVANILQKKYGYGHIPAYERIFVLGAAARRLPEEISSHTDRHDIYRELCGVLKVACGIGDREKYDRMMRESDPGARHCI